MEMRALSTGNTIKNPFQTDLMAVPKTKRFTRFFYLFRKLSINICYKDYNSAFSKEISLTAGVTAAE
jgi:hypothetical protein